MSEARKNILAGIAILVGQGLSRGLGVLLLPILTMVFLPAQFGMSALATSYVSFVSVVALLGLDLTYLQSIPGAQKPDATINLRVIWTLTLALSITASVIGSVAWWVWGKQTPESTPWLALGIFSTMIFSVAQSQLKADRKYLQLAMALSTGGIVMYLWVLIRGLSGHDQAITLVSGYALGAASAVLISRPVIHIASPGSMPELAVLWRLVRIGLPAAFSAPVFWIISSMDRWFVAQFWGVSEAGIYSVAASISGIGLLFGSVVQTIWMTEASRLYNIHGAAGKESLAERMKEIFFLFAIAWLVLTAFSGEIVHVFAKPPYDSAITYLPWLLTSVMLYGLMQAMSAYLVISKTLNKSIAVWLSGGMMFVAMGILSSKIMGPVGIAVAQAITYTFMLLWMFLLVRRNAGLKIRLGIAAVLAVLILLTGIVMLATQDAKFNQHHFVYRLLGVVCLAALTGWHFRSQLHFISTGKKLRG